MRSIKPKSFIMNSIISNTISLITILLLCLAIYIMADYKLEKSFPTLNDLLVYSDKLVNDEFEKIPIRKFNNTSIIVYDSNKKILFSSGKTIKEKLEREDFELINDYNYEYYKVYDFIDENNNRRYYIMKIKKDKETENDNLVDFAILNSKLEIIEGNLFENKKQISKFQLDLVSGKYNENTIEKHQYNNEKGEQRTLIMIAPAFTTANYEQAIIDANKYWILAIPLILLVIFIEMYIHNRKLKKSLEPMHSIITSYEKNEPIKIEDYKIEKEFQPMIQKFMLLLEKINKHELEKNTLIANISHDLKTPLTAIKGYTQAIRDKIAPENKKEQFLNSIYDNTVIATDLINRLFEYTKLEHPEYNIQLEKTNINEFFRKYFMNKLPEIEIKGFILNLQIPEKTCICNIDKELITRLLDNLMSNTFKYNTEGTSILFEIIDKNENVKIIIADNGRGISEEIKDNLFEAFVTENEARTSGKGTGLGMAIVKKIVELHNGTIILNEYPTHGYSTEFDIELKKYSD